MRPGFRPDGDEDDDYPQPIGVGIASTLDDDAPAFALAFSNHIYVVLRIGPFALVVGRLDGA